MSIIGKITKVGTGKDDKHGNSVYYLDIDSEPKVERGYLAAKTFEPRVGEEITVEVRAGQYGPILKRIVPEGGGGQSRGGGGRRDVNGRSIERQVALKVAGELWASWVREREIQGVDLTGSVLRTAQRFDDFLAASARPGVDGPPPSAESTTAERADSGGSPKQETLVGDGEDIPF